MRKAPTLRNNNGALQVRVRLDGKDHFINRFGRFEDPVARARAQAISAEIWRNYQQGQLDRTCVVAYTAREVASGAFCELRGTRTILNSNKSTKIHLFSW